MLTKLDAHDLIEALGRLTDMDAIARKDPAFSYGKQSNVDYQIRGVEIIKAETAKLGLRLANRKAGYLLVVLNEPKNIQAPQAFAEAARAGISELRDLIAGELEERHIYVLDRRGTDALLNLPSPFGDTITDKFPLAIEDIAEACWCLGLSRNTAVVFHLMRAMEIAVKVIGDKLEVTVVDKDNVDLEWGRIVANLKVPIEAMPKGPGRDKWSGVLTMLYHVKQKWRNPTMHPKQTYTDDEARDVYEAVKSFMLDLAEVA